MKPWWTGLLGLLLLSVRVGIPATTAAPAPAAPLKQPTVSGLISSEATGRPLPGATVEIFEQVDVDAQRERRASGVIVPEPLAKTTADGNGRFRLPAPSGRRIVVVAQAPGHARSRFGRPMVLPTGPEDRDMGDLPLPEGRRLTGRVLDASGKPVAGARVIALLPSRRAQRGGAGAGFARAFTPSRFAVPFPAATVTDPDGGFALDSAPRRAVSLRVYADKLAPALVENPPAARPITVKMTAGHPLAGRVIAPDGRTPVAGAWVLAGDDGLDGIARSDAKGSFKLERLAAGPVEIVASVPSAAADLDDARSTYAPSAPARLVLPVPADPNTPAQRRSPTLRLRPGGIVRARVLDEETREAVIAASLLLDAPGEPQPRPAVTEGPDEILFAGVPAGNVGLRAEADGYLDAEAGTLPLAAGQTRAVTLALRPAARLEGTVRDATGRPVSGAVVSVGGPPPMPLPVPIYFPVGVDPVESDAKGLFVLEKLPPKVDLKISVDAEGFVPWEMPGIRLRPAEKRAGMEVLLDAGLMIAGRVVDPDGKPVGGAGVTATRRREGGPGGMVIRIDRGGGPGRGGGRGGPRSGGAGGMEGDAHPPVTTDKEGLFRVRGAKPGVYSLEVRSPGFAPRSVGGLKLEESASSLDAGEIRLEPGASIRGRVATPAGEPVPFARGFARKEFSPLGEFTTAEDGTFVLADLAPTDGVILAIDADGYGGVEKAGITVPAEGLEITLVPSSRVSGRVLDRETRQPIPDFAIAISRTRGAGGGGMRMSNSIAGPETAFHTEDGVFTIEDVDPGKASIAARAPGYREFALREIEVPEGQDLADLEFTLERSGSVSGIVLDDRGRPLPGVEVSKKEASAGGMGFVMRLGGAGDDGALTDGEGRFVLSGLERGPMTLSFAHAEFETAERDVDTTRDVEELRVTLSRGGSLTGIVLREADGSPVTGATVTASAAGTDRFSGGKSSTTGPDGTFTFESVTAGRYTVRAEAPGLSPATANDLMVTAGAAPPPIELRLGGGVTVTGTITGVKESELSQFTVRALPGGGMGGFGTSAPVDAAGRFELKGMSAGTVTLLAASGIFGGKSTTRSIEIPEGSATFETTIEFPRGSRVEGTVTRGTRPVEGATVLFINQISRSSVSATTDASGKYAAEDLDDGEYSVAVMQFTAGLSHSTKATVKGDRELDIEIPLAKITGHVTDAATGEPIDGATISIKREGGAPASAGAGFFFRQEAGTDASGYYQVEGLDDGTWTLTARKEGYGFVPKTLTFGGGVAPGEVSFELSRVDAFTFRALDAASGQPIRSLGVLVTTGGGDPLAPTGSGAATVFQDRLSADASGLFRLESLRPGTYRMVLGGQFLATETLHDVKVPGPELTVRMAPGGSIETTAPGLAAGKTARGMLLDATGRPVHFNTMLPEPTFILRADAPTGLSDLKPGAYRLRVSMPSGGTAEKPVTIVAGETVRVSIP